MSADKIAKRVFIELNRLHEQSFTTWMTKVLDLANDYNLNIKQNRHLFKYECKMVVIDRFISNWHNHLINTEINPGLRTYQTIKKSFRLEPYLYLVREAPFVMRLRKYGRAHIPWPLSVAVTLDRKRQIKKDFASRVVLLKTRRILYCLVI